MWDGRFKLSNIDDYIRYNDLNTWVNSHLLSFCLKKLTTRLGAILQETYCNCNIQIGLKVKESESISIQISIIKLEWLY